MAPRNLSQCLYDTLGVVRSVDPDKLTIAYRKLAMKWHPDKIQQSWLGHSADAYQKATERFEQINRAYEILSDPVERTWYDSHRERILAASSSSANAAPGEFDLPLWNFFSPFAYSGYGETGNGFYAVYREIFKKVHMQEQVFGRMYGDREVGEAPELGGPETPYQQVYSFYRYWQGFSSVKDFGWCDEFDVLQAPNRKVRRLMEEENNKVRKREKREFNNTVRQLATFVKKRDKRVIEKQLELQKQQKQKEEERKARQLAREKEKPEDVVARIYSNFPDEAKDLGQLLEMIDSGQAVDISGLLNMGLVVLLRKLFSALNLSFLGGTHLLPKGAESTMKRLALVFKELAATTPTGPAETRIDVESSALKNRVMGPAMPSADMLAAAARLSEAQARLREAELELDNDPLIGPAPATVVAEAASANDAERFEEVTRMISRDVKNAYDLLGVKSDVEPALLKKKYWKLSLLVHPDKCDHPQAHEAFMALNKAFKDLQDPTKKAEIDRKVAEEVAREEFAAELQAKREAAQWRRLQGEEEEGDDDLLRGPQEVARDEWMTKLPPERQAGGPPAQQNTFFSKSEKSGRGDTSVWTDTPADKAEKAKMQYLEAYKQAALTNGPAAELEEREKERAAKEAQLMDSYNSHERSQSLVEKHQAEKAAGVKKKKTKKVEKEGGFSKPGDVGEEPEWKVNHPWKPWDRERDIAAGRKSVNLDPKNFKEALSSRFGGFTDSEPRKFL